MIVFAGRSRAPSGLCGGPWRADTGLLIHSPTHSLTLWSGCKYGVRFYSQIATLQQWDHTAVIITLIVMESSATEGLTAKSVSFTTDLIFYALVNKMNIILNYGY